jgi:hypothetical protein
MYDGGLIAVESLIGAQAHAGGAAGAQSLRHDLVFYPGLALIFFRLDHYYSCSLFSHVGIGDRRSRSIFDRTLSGKSGDRLMHMGFNVENFDAIYS